MNDGQFRSARAILKLGVREMAELVGVSHFTVGRMEAGEPVKPATVEKVRLALEAAGIEFIPENGGGPGIRDNRKAPAETALQNDSGTGVRMRKP